MTPAPRPERIVDPHVHLWNPARRDWYPYLSTEQAGLNMGDVTGMARRFDCSDYAAEADGWNVEKIVNVAAATNQYSIDETLELDRQAADVGGPDAIIGGLPYSDSVAEMIAALDRQSAAARFRGVRPMGDHNGPLPADEVLQELDARDLIYEIMAHPDQLTAAAQGLANHGGLSVVVEHTGWPRDASDTEYRLWRNGIDALAGLSPSVTCKLSGLAMPLGSIDARAFAPWIEHAIDAFGVDRCFFASNFPVDGLHGTLDNLWATYSTVTEGLSPEVREKLFAINAERVYGL